MKPLNKKGDKKRSKERRSKSNYSSSSKKDSKKKRSPEELLPKSKESMSKLKLKLNNLKRLSLRSKRSSKSSTKSWNSPQSWWRTRKILERRVQKRRAPGKGARLKAPWKRLMNRSRKLTSWKAWWWRRFQDLKGLNQCSWLKSKSMDHQEGSL